MSPDLERLLEALHQKLTCPPQEKAHRAATFERLLRDTLAGHPATSRDEFLDALRDRYRQFLHARRRPSSMPPRAHERRLLQFKVRDLNVIANFADTCFVQNPVNKALIG